MKWPACKKQTIHLAVLQEVKWPKPFPPGSCIFPAPTHKSTERQKFPWTLAEIKQCPRDSSL